MTRPLPKLGKLRLGLCCQFVKEPIRFRTTTATAMMRLSREEQLKRISLLCLDNVEALRASISYCAVRGIGAFRINSQILPLKTHPVVGYSIAELPNNDLLVARFRACGEFAANNQVRLSFHPDQFVVLNSPNRQTLARSLAELDYHAEIAEWVGADTINLHGGGAYGEKMSALKALCQTIEWLPESVRSRLTLENDDKVFTPQDLLPVCEKVQVPFVYDVHHHRCLPDQLSSRRASELALETWNREPLFHISSPLEGWGGRKPQPHHDYISPSDFPDEWLELELTVEVEAKAKELAVARLQKSLATRGASLHG